MRLELEQFCAVNHFNKEQLKELLSKNGVSEKDLIVIDFIQFWSENAKFRSPYNNYKDPYGSTRKYLTDVNKYIKSNKNIYMPKYMIFFHSTASHLKDKILEEGLLPTSNTRRRSYQSTNGYVYLASNKNKAVDFCNLGNGLNICTFAVLVKTTDILMDLDQLRNKKASANQYGYGEDIKETLADSIWYGGGVRVKGMIQPYQIILMKESILE